MVIKMSSSGSGSVLSLFFMNSYWVTKLVCEKTHLMKTPKSIKEGSREEGWIYLYFSVIMYIHTLKYMESPQLYP